MPVPESEYLSPIWKDGIFSECDLQQAPESDPDPQLQMAA